MRPEIMVYQEIDLTKRCKCALQYEETSKYAGNWNPDHIHPVILKNWKAFYYCGECGGYYPIKEAIKQ